MRPVRSRAYLAWIRSLPCLACQTIRNVEAAHVGPHAMAQKASDLSTVPLCAAHHRATAGALP